MKAFGWRDVSAAVRLAAVGGMALHVHRFCPAGAPAPFRRAVDAGGSIAHLFDWDGTRAMLTARRLQVGRVVLDRKGSASRHVDLCGRPLQKAQSIAAGDAAGLGRAIHLLGRRFPEATGAPDSRHYRAGWRWYADGDPAAPGDSSGRLPKGDPDRGPGNATRGCDGCRPCLPRALLERMRAAEFRTRDAALEAAGAALAAVIRELELPLGRTAVSLDVLRAAGLGVLGRWWLAFDPRVRAEAERLSESEFDRRVRLTFGRAATPGEVRLAFGDREDTLADPPPAPSEGL